MQFICLLPILEGCLLVIYPCGFGMVNVPLVNEWLSFLLETGMKRNWGPCSASAPSYPLLQHSGRCIWVFPGAFRAAVVGMLRNTLLVAPVPCCCLHCPCHTCFFLTTLPPHPSPVHLGLTEKCFLLPFLGVLR